MKRYLYNRFTAVFETEKRSGSLSFFSSSTKPNPNMLRDVREMIKEDREDEKVVILNILKLN